MSPPAKHALTTKSTKVSRRLHLLLVLTVFAFAVLLFRLWTIQVLKHQDYQIKAMTNYVREIPIPSLRGKILDRNGIILAEDELHYEVWVPIITENRKRVITPEMEETFRILAKYIKPYIDTEEDYIKRLKDRYLEGKRDLYYKHARVRIEKNLEFEQFAPVVTRQNLEFPEEAPVHIVTTQKRIYRRQDLAAHVLGYTAEISPQQLNSPAYADYKQGDLIGKAGIEKQYETYLRGKEGSKKIFVDRFEIQRGEAGDADNKPAEPGYNVVLNIDSNLQRVAEQTLGASKGVIIVSDPRDNSILAMASNPRYNPNHYSRDYAKNARDRINNPLFHRAAMGLYPPGSVIKIFESVALMEELGISGNYTVGCQGKYFIRSGVPIHCHKIEGHGSVSHTDAVRLSCNVFYYKTIQNLGFERLYFWMTEFGFNDKTGIDLPEFEETYSPYPTPNSVRSWHEPATLIMLAIGQAELRLTPLQIHTAVCAIANGGKLYPPRLAQKILPPEILDSDASSAFEIQPKQEPRIIEAAPETWEMLQHAMWEVVNNYGTGRRVKNDDFVLAGKTGTAQNPGPDTHAWFVAYGPFEDPTIAVTVLVEHSGHGGEIASPLIEPILKTYLNNPVIASAN